LLEQEAELRRRTEAVAEARRELPVGGAVPEELLFAPSEPGQDPRHSDTTDPLWNLFDFTPDGRGTDWDPQLRYG
jgi:predicted dithiol-disulfide oxidoreductase (DUF899 family)